MSERYGYILMIKEKYWIRSCEQNRAGKTTHAYIGGGAAPPKNASQVFFYVVYPFREIRGFGEFIERIVDDSEKLWNSHGYETCLDSHEQYDDLMRGKDKATFVRFKNLHEGFKPIPFNMISVILEIEKMPRRGRYINKEQANELIRLLE